MAAPKKIKQPQSKNSLQHQNRGKNKHAYGGNNAEIIQAA
jgi:hypothetical protein